MEKLKTLRDYYESLMLKADDELSRAQYYAAMVAVNKSIRLLNGEEIEEVLGLE